MTNSELCEAAAADLLAVRPSDRLPALDRLARDYATARRQEDPAISDRQAQAEASLFVVQVALRVNEALAATRQ